MRDFPFMAVLVHQHMLVTNTSKLNTLTINPYALLDDFLDFSLSRITSAFSCSHSPALREKRNRKLHFHLFRIAEQERISNDDNDDEN